MSREHLFKAKTIKEGKWIYGDLIHSWHKMNTKPTTMIYNTLGKTEVDHTTVCEYTGLTDKNKTKIFEGDIVKIFEQNYLVVWNKERCTYYLKRNQDEIFIVEFATEFYEVIGNIFDNEELLK